MAINVNRPDFGGLRGSAGTPNLPSVGALGLQGLQLSQREKEAQRQEALEKMRLRSMDERAMRQAQLERAKMNQQANQFRQQQALAQQELGAQQNYRQQQLQQDAAGQQLRKRGQDLQFGLGQQQVAQDKQEQAFEQMKLGVERLAEKEEQELDRFGSFAVSAKVAMEQIQDPTKKHLVRKQIIDEAVKMGHISEKKGETMKKVPLGAFNRSLDMAISQADKASDLKALRQGEEGLKITRPDGTVVEFQEPTGPVKTQAQKDVMNREKALKKLAPIRNEFNKNYFTVRGQLGLESAKIAERWEGIPIAETVTKMAADQITGKTEKEQAQFVRNATKYLNSVEQFFQQEYRKPITGAQAAVEELKQLRRSFLSGDMSPSEFKGSIDAILQNYTSETEFKKHVLRKGVDVSEKDDPWGIL